MNAKTGSVHALVLLHDVRFSDVWIAQGIQEQLGSLEGEIRDSVAQQETLTTQLATACQAAVNADNRAMQVKALMLPSELSGSCVPPHAWGSLAMCCNDQGRWGPAPHVLSAPRCGIHAQFSRRPKPTMLIVRLASGPQHQKSPHSAPTSMRLKALPRCPAAPSSMLLC
jgi:hypothetical protein